MGHSLDEINIWEKSLGFDRIQELYNEGAPVLFMNPTFNTEGLASWFRMGDSIDQAGDTYTNSDTTSILYDRFGTDTLTPSGLSTISIETDSHGSTTLLKNKYEAAINFPTASTIVGV